MTDLIAELEAVVRLAEKATPGPWVRSQLANVVIREWRDEQGLNQVIAGRPADDWLCTAAVNFLRTHHAEIAAAVRDSQRIDFLQREVDEIGAFLLHNGKGRGSGFTGLGLQNTGRTLRQAIDQCIDAGAAMRAGEGEG